MTVMFPQSMTNCYKNIYTTVQLPLGLKQKKVKKVKVKNDT